MTKKHSKKEWRTFKIEVGTYDLKKPFVDVLMNSILLYPNVPEKHWRIVEVIATLEYEK